MENNYNNIFISYAKEDINYAENLYDFLHSKSYNPWLDKKKLNVGQNWEFHIQDALHKADFIILLLSTKSVNKRGYVQREFRKALEYCEYKLDSDIFVIPLKIDDCEVPMNLQKFQWIDYDNNAFDQIEKSIEIQRKLLLNTPNTLEISNHHTIHVTNQVKQGELGNHSPKHIYEFHYPQFDTTEEESLFEINTLIQNDILNSMLAVRANFYNYLINIRDENAIDSVNQEDSSSYGKIEIKHVNSRFISFTSLTSEYYTGTPHGMFGTIGHNYFMNPIRRFDFIELFADHNNYLQKIRDIVHEKLMILAEKSDLYYADGEGVEMSPADKRNSFYVYDEGLLPVKENFDNYYFKENSIVFIYNPYHITAWSEGDHFPEVTFVELLDYFPNEQKLTSFIKSTILLGD